MILLILQRSAKISQRNKLEYYRRLVPGGSNPVALKT